MPRIISAAQLLRASYSTLFPLVENPISEGGNWINGGTVGLDWTNCSSEGGLAIGHEVGASATDATSVLTGAWKADQDITAVVHTINQVDGCFQEAEMRLRTVITPHSITGYEVSWHLSTTASAYVIIVRWNGPQGNFTYLFNDGGGAQYAVTNGDTLRAKIVGNVITAYINGVQKATVDITSLGGIVYSTGAPGMGFNLESANLGGTCAGTNGDYGYTSWSVTAS